MEVSRLSEEFVRPLEEYLREDSVKNAFLLHDLYEERDKSDFYLALEGSEVKSVLLIYRGGSRPAGHLRGEKESSSQLVEKLEPDQMVLISPPELTDDIKDFLSVTDLHPVELMLLNKGTEEPLTQHPVRELTGEDIDEIAELWAQWRGSWDDHAQRLERRMSDPKYSHYGIELEDEGLISTAYSVKMLSDMANIGGIYTKPEYREKGYGTSVTSKAVEESLKEAAKITLIVGSENGPAKHIYEKLGFTTYCKFDWLDLQADRAP